jgi:hypothetical protein
MSYVYSEENRPKICSQHFTTDQITIDSKGKRKLNKDATPCFNLHSITQYPEFNEIELQNEDNSKFKVYQRKRSGPLYVPIVPIKVKISESRVDDRISSEFILVDQRSGVPELDNKSIGKLSCRFLVAITLKASYLVYTLDFHHVLSPNPVQLSDSTLSMENNRFGERSGLAGGSVKSLGKDFI